MNVFQAKPDCLDTRLAVTLAGKEAANACNLAQHPVQPGLLRRHHVVQEVGGLYFTRIEEQLGVESGAGSPHPHQVVDAPSDHHEQRDGAHDQAATLTVLSLPAGRSTLRPTVAGALEIRVSLLTVRLCYQHPKTACRKVNGSGF